MAVNSAVRNHRRVQDAVDPKRQSQSMREIKFSKWADRLDNKARVAVVVPDPQASSTIKKTLYKRRQ